MVTEGTGKLRPSEPIWEIIGHLQQPREFVLMQAAPARASAPDGSSPFSSSSSSLLRGLRCEKQSVALGWRGRQGAGLGELLPPRRAERLVGACRAREGAGGTWPSSPRFKGQKGWKAACSILQSHG